MKLYKIRKEHSVSKHPLLTLTFTVMCNCMHVLAFRTKTYKIPQFDFCFWSNLIYPYQGYGCLKFESNAEHFHFCYIVLF